MQTAPLLLAIDAVSGDSHVTLKSDVPVKGVYVTLENVAVWSGKKVVVHDLGVPSLSIREKSKEKRQRKKKKTLQVSILCCSCYIVCVQTYHECHKDRFDSKPRLHHSHMTVSSQLHIVFTDNHIY